MNIELICSDLESTIAFYTEQCGFQLDLIFPADAPRVVELSGYGIYIRLVRDKDLRQVTDGEWVTGRAGMQYRDLIPDRWGGRLIASHIRIPHGGPVPDYVHYHDVEFQTIYCCRGWVRVVYEDQGTPFVLEAGDCVLQPPRIRHRVLECSDHLEVIEVTSPAEHKTLVEHNMELPTDQVDSSREFGGQRFVRHRSNEAKWFSGPYDGFEARDTGIGDATKGLASVLVIRSSGHAKPVAISCEAGCVFVFVLQGTMTLLQKNRPSKVFAANDAFAVSAGMPATVLESSSNLEFLQVVSNQVPD